MSSLLHSKGLFGASENRVVVDEFVDGEGSCRRTSKFLGHIERQTSRLLGMHGV